MGEKIETAKKVRAEQAKKWAEFFDSGQPFTKEKREEMEADNRELEKICKEATKEWLEEDSEE